MEWRRLLWWRLVRRGLLSGQRLWLELGHFGRPRLVGRLRRLRIRPGLCRACVRRPGVCRARLHRASCLLCTGLCQAGLRDPGLRDGPGARLCPRSPGDLYRPGLRQVSNRTGPRGCFGCLHPGPVRPALDAAARPDNGSDLHLDDSPEHDPLLRHHSLAANWLSKGVVRLPRPIRGRP